MDAVPFEDFGGTVVYDLEQKHTIREIFERAKKEEKKSKVTTNYFSLIEGLELPNVVTNLVLSQNGEYLYLGGSDPPQFVCFELESFSEKLRQHTNYHILKMLSLPSDPFKIVCLYRNRWVEFFCKQGKHEKIRVPKHSHDMFYHPTSCDLHVFGYGKNIWRFNLEQGQFLKSLELFSKNIDEVLCGDINPVHHLFAYGCSNGVVEFMDPRAKKIKGIIDVCKHIRRKNPELYKPVETVHKIRFDDTGISFGVGTNFGQVGLFDLRKDGLVLMKDHLNETAVTSLQFHKHHENSRRLVLSSDKYCVKIWDKLTATNITNMEPRKWINDVVVFPRSGMLFVAQEREKVTPYYVPILGPVPYWCSFLNQFIGNSTSSKRKERVSVNYTQKDYKFVSVEKLKEMGLEELIGTKVLKPHLHGYLMSLKVFNNAEKLQRTDVEKILRDHEREDGRPEDEDDYFGRRRRGGDDDDRRREKRDRKWKKKRQRQFKHKRRKKRTKR